MDRNYWEKIAPDYNEEIFDVLANDKKKIVQKTIKKFASKHKTVIDIGCAIGKWLPILSPAFKKVYAIDISQQNLDIAKQIYSKLENVNYERVDMSNPKAKIIKCDFAICINAILTGTMQKRNVFFKNLQKSVKKDGHIILVVPSLESAMLTSIIRKRWDPDKDSRKMINKKNPVAQLKNIFEGNTSIDGVSHKHYLKEELKLLLMNEGFATEEFSKIEYEWDTEFNKPPKWLKEPRPWDWMALAKKK
jgi:2-polyprenyl-3-methyl-5-hydroxy-6-metoxy-1,4-benzoquinol methylase